MTKKPSSKECKHLCLMSRISIPKCSSPKLSLSLPRISSNKFLLLLGQSISTKMKIKRISKRKPNRIYFQTTSLRSSNFKQPTAWKYQWWCQEIVRATSSWWMIANFLEKQRQAMDFSIQILDLNTLSIKWLSKSYHKQVRYNANAVYWIGCCKWCRNWWKWGL